MGRVIQFPNVREREKNEEDYMPEELFRENAQRLILQEATEDKDLLYVMQLATAAFADMKISEFTSHNMSLSDATTKATELTADMLQAMTELMTGGYLL